MTVIAAIQVDLTSTTVGTACRLANVIAGKSILRHTIDRVERISSVEVVCVLCPTGQKEACQNLLAGSKVRIIAYDAEPAPWTPIVRAGRKWSLDGWRGGIGGTTYFDEFIDCRLLLGLLETVAAKVVLCVPSAAPLFDATLADRMIEHYRTSDEDIRMVFAQAPPGLCGALLDADLIRDLANQSVPVGWVFSYQPDNPRKDLIFEPCCLQVPAEVRYARGRLVADTDRALRTIDALVADGNDRNATDVGRWLIDREAAMTEPMPLEVEIELTTDDPYPDTLLRARGDRLERREPIDPALVARIVSELTVHDDSLVVLGGFGDPLRHPDFQGVLRAVRSAGGGPFGLAVRTTGVDLTDEIIEALIEHRVDVLSVTLDAWSPELYGRMHCPGNPGSADLDAVKQRLRRVDELRGTHQSALPLIVPEMTKTRDNVCELDDFYDGWIRTIGAAAISGYTHYAGQLEDRSVMDMAPPGRVACRRLRSRCVVLADGRVTMCDQDFNGTIAIGSLHEHSLAELWRGAAFSALRSAHEAGRFDANPLCNACNEWHRP